MIVCSCVCAGEDCAKKARKVSVFEAEREKTGDWNEGGAGRNTVLERMKRVCV